MMSGARKKANSSRHFPFTLIEIAVSLILLGLLSSILGWQMTKLLGAHRLRTSAQAVVSELKKLQALALCYQTELQLKIYTDKEGKVHYQVATDEPKMLGRKAKAGLPGIQSFTFNKKPEKSIDITIHSSGRIDPAQILVLSGKSTNQITIDLSGSPLVKIN